MKLIEISFVKGFGNLALRLGLEIHRRIAIISHQIGKLVVYWRIPPSLVLSKSVIYMKFELCDTGIWQSLFHSANFFAHL